MHRRLTEVDRRSHWCTESWRKVLLMHRKLTDGPSDARKVDWSWWKVVWTHEELTKVDKRFQELMERWCNLTERPSPHRKLTDIDERSCRAQNVNRRYHGCAENWWYFLRTYVDLTEVEGRSRDAWKVKATLQKVLRMHRRFREYSAAAQKVAEGPRAALKFNESPTDAQKVNWVDWRCGSQAEC